MPPQRHKVPGKAFAAANSEMVQWVMRELQVDEKRACLMIGSAQQAGYLVYDNKTATWTGSARNGYMKWQKDPATSTDKPEAAPTETTGQPAPVAIVGSPEWRAEMAARVARYDAAKKAAPTTAEEEDEGVDVFANLPPKPAN